eukprot:CAMPEP_0184861676 /NCGR_PEP_ID=MMETSP0580-20130426/6302_1 /TAXON_ID=1118495 /ORGANISM="Dactyliosolen fragilissimus" /LENGTH=876 /DNA_ID=CAMNT_0027359249 /DNA_START=258 /DNA_END=2888 /DNA_ORIENTATION=-
MTTSAFLAGIDGRIASTSSTTTTTNPHALAVCESNHHQHGLLSSSSSWSSSPKFVLQPFKGGSSPSFVGMSNNRMIGSRSTSSSGAASSSTCRFATRETWDDFSYSNNNDNYNNYNNKNSYNSYSSNEYDEYGNYDNSYENEYYSNPVNNRRPPNNSVMASSRNQYTAMPMSMPTGQSTTTAMPLSTSNVPQQRPFSSPLSMSRGRPSSTASYSTRRRGNNNRNDYYDVPTEDRFSGDYLTKDDYQYSSTSQNLGSDYYDDFDTDRDRNWNGSNNRNTSRNRSWNNSSNRNVADRNRNTSINKNRNTSNRNRNNRNVYETSTYYDEDYNNDYGYSSDMDGRYQDGYRNDRPMWQWESYGKETHIYLPSSSYQSPNSNRNRTPKNIIHFIGGTLFGSYPLKFYAPLLEPIAQRTNSIVVVTSIPFTLDANPLDHIRLSQRIASNFGDAYQNVLVDEYGSEMTNQMKIIGMGHSLGSRLHCILSTNDKLNDMALGRRAANILIAFNNFDAVNSIPGAKSLSRNLRQTINMREDMMQQDMEKDMETRRNRRRRQGRDWQNAYGEEDVYDGYLYGRKREPNYVSGSNINSQYNTNANYNRSRRNNNSNYNYNGQFSSGKSPRDTFYDNTAKTGQRPYSRNQSYRYDNNNNYEYDDNYDEIDDMDIEFGDVVRALSRSMRNGVSTLRSTLTPDSMMDYPSSSMIEFTPSPGRLWNKLEDGSYSYNVKDTLIIQFDRDDIDQGPRLSRAITTANEGMNSNNKRNNDFNLFRFGKNKNKQNVKFARLKGTHLTPVNYVSYKDSIGIKNAWRKISALPIDNMLREGLGDDWSDYNYGMSGTKRPRNSSRKMSNKANDMYDLVSSIVTYIDSLPEFDDGMESENF